MSTPMPQNLLFADVEYKIKTTSFGEWRRFMYPDGSLFEEFVSHRSVLGWPLVHFTSGKSPETGKRVVAKGIFAIGRLAVGVVAVGQASARLLAVGQLAIGLLLGLGQACTGCVAIGQLAIASVFALCQFAVGYAAIGQLAFGKYTLAQFGMGEYVWDTRGVAPQAEQFFKSLIP